MNRDEWVKHYISIYPEFVENMEVASRKLERAIWGQRFSYLYTFGHFHRRIGICKYLMDGDVQSFRSSLSEYASFELRIYEAYEAGEDVDPSRVSMLGGYKALFGALASGDFALAERISAILGGRDAIEKEYDHPFTYTIGYLLKSFVDGETAEERRRRIEEFRKYAHEEHCEGHLKVFEAILEEDSAALPAAFDELLAGHQKAVRRDALLANNFGKVLSLWGIGLANLARHRGLEVTVDDPYIPAELLIGQAA